MKKEQIVMASGVEKKCGRPVFLYIWSLAEQVNLTEANTAKLHCIVLESFVPGKLQVKIQFIKTDICSNVVTLPCNMKIAGRCFAETQVKTISDVALCTSGKFYIPQNVSTRTNCK